MTKAEELKVLDKIETMIKSAGADSYIAGTFAGIVEICRDNIENDFGNHPVEDLAAARKKMEELNNVARAALADYDKLQADFDELAGAYREAVKASDAARVYAVAAAREAKKALDGLDAETDGDTIAYTFRQMKKAEQAVHLTYEVQQRAYSRPYVELMKEEEKSA